MTALVLHDEAPDGGAGEGGGAFGAARGDDAELNLSPLSFVPGLAIEATLGPLCLHLIKETWTLREEGGIGSFSHAFVSEAHALARAHTCARGGNAVLKYRFTQLKLSHSPYKNHAYVLLCLQGDVVRVHAHVHTHGGGVAVAIQ